MALVGRRALLHKLQMTAPPRSPEIFDRTLRAARRERAAGRFADHDFVHQVMVEELAERLETVVRPLPEVLLLGCPDGRLREALEAMGKTVICADPAFALAARQGGVQCDEDALPFADASFDLVIACGTLDSVNDLPGALILINRVLRADGLLLAALTGAPSLGMLRACLIEGEGDRAGQHIHPQIDLRAAGDLLQRAGFALPVVDSLGLSARYASLDTLMHDLRHMGSGNALRGRSPLTRGSLARARAAFAHRAEPDGKTTERFTLMFLSGWKPDPGQPQPARRGSATVSLAQALGDRGEKQG